MPDMGEKHVIHKIAAAHGGHSNGDKDKILRLLETDSLLEWSKLRRAYSFKGLWVKMRQLSGVLIWASRAPACGGSIKRETQPFCGSSTGRSGIKA